jgi:hypothetical protein
MTIRTRPAWHLAARADAEEGIRSLHLLMVDDRHSEIREESPVHLEC